MNRMNRIIFYFTTACFLLINLDNNLTHARGIIQQESHKHTVQKNSQQQRTIQKDSQQQRTIVIKGHKESITVQAEERTPPVIRIDGSIMKMEVNDGRVTLWVSVGNENLEPLKNLRRENYTITETINNLTRRVPVEEIALKSHGSEYPFITVLLRDVSSSLDAVALKQVNLAISTCIDQMASGQISELIDFGLKVTVRQKFTTDKNALKRALENPTVEEATAFYDGLLRAIDDLQKIPNHQSLKLIIAGSDGGENRSKHSLEEILQAAKESAIPIFCIGVGSANEAVMQHIAKETNGLYFYAPTAESLTLVYEKIATLLNGMYIVSFPTSARKGDSVSVNMIVEYAGLGKKVTSQFEIAKHKLP